MTFFQKSRGVVHQLCKQTILNYSDWMMETLSSWLRAKPLHSHSISCPSSDEETHYSLQRGQLDHWGTQEIQVSVTRMCDKTSNNLKCSTKGCFLISPIFLPKDQNTTKIQPNILKWKATSLNPLNFI